MTTDNLTLQLAKFCRGAAYETMSESAVTVTKTSLLDTLGCLVSGTASSHWRDLVDGLGLTTTGDVPVLGSDLRANVFLSALANEAAAHMESFDDYVVRAGGHAGVSVIPAAIAAAPPEATGKQLLSAILVGYEVMTLLGDRLHNYSYERGFHATGTHGALAAAAAAAAVSSLDEQQFASSIGLAVSQAAGLRVQFGSMAKPFQAGHAAMAGVLSASLAAAGCVPGDDPLGGVAGLIECVVGSANRDKVVALLLESTQRHPGSFVAQSPPTTKLHASCGSTHSVVDCALQLRENFDLASLQKIDRIDIALPATTLRTLVHHRPDTGLEGKYSAEFTVAIALVYGDAGSARFDDSVVDEPLIKALVGSAFTSADQKLQQRRDLSDGALPARVTITSAGRVVVAERMHPRGAPQAPLAWSDVAAKFRSNAEFKLGTRNADAAIEAVANVQDLTDIRSELLDYFVI